MKAPRNFDVYFEIYGKKLKTTVSAGSEAAAKEIIKEKIIFHKVARSSNDPLDPLWDMMDDVINNLNK